jgi:hypothetical protein
MPAYLLLF